MNKDKITISGTGCAVADYLYKHVSFESEAFKQYLSRKTGDGGFTPGGLVFAEELERFASKPYQEILEEITNGKEPDALNIGGPSIVALIHVAQLLNPADFDVNFYGIAGNDATADQLLELVKRTALDPSNYKKTGTRPTPFTDVFSDAAYHDGHGERTFVNSIGAAGEFQPEDLPDDFFSADLVCFGGTALVPQLHDHLTPLLKKVKERGRITLVNTIYDFRNEHRHPEKPWPLVDSDADYELIDILIMDCEEALKICGKSLIHEAADCFAEKKVSSFLITNGSRDLVAYSDGRLFREMPITPFPVSTDVNNLLTKRPELKGDTTGCGDNFVGGLIASVGLQLKTQKPGAFDLAEAISWAVASGGFACLCVGGTYFEKHAGDKRKHILQFKNGYDQQLQVVSR